MRLVYGSYRHDENEASPTDISRTIVESQRGTPERLRTRVTIAGRKLAQNAPGKTAATLQAEMTARLTAMERAYQVWGRDLAWLDDAGRPTPHGVVSSQTVAGVKVIEPVSYTGSGETIYGLYRDYRIVLEWDTVPAEWGGAAQSTVASFSETVSFRGDGGPIKVILQTLSGSPIEQTTAERTPYFATQTGSAARYGRFFEPPRPIWPDKQQGLDSQRTYQSVDQQTGLYRTDWSYSFLSATPLIGFPNSL